MSRQENVKRWSLWQFSLRSLLLAILFVATFCLGWICNEQWRFSLPPSLNAAQAERNAFLLNAMGELTSQIQDVDTERAGDSDFNRLDRETRMDRAAKMRNAISKRISNQNATMWRHITVISISACVLSFAVGLRLGRRSAHPSATQI